MEQQFGAPELAVVVEAHRAAVRTRVVDDNAVADVDLRQLAVDGKLIVVLAERARDVVDVVARFVLLARDRDVMVSAVHGRAHEVGHAGVEADVVLVGLLLVDSRRDEPASRARDGAAALRHHGDIAETFRHHHLVVELVDALADGFEVDRLFLRAVGDADAAADVDEFDVDAEAVLELDGQFEHELRREDEGLRAALVRGDHRVQAKALDALLLGHLVGLEELVARQAVLRFRRLADDVIALDEVARVVAEADDLRQASVLLEVIEVADVVEVDDGTELDGFLELVGRRVVGRQQNLLTLVARDFREYELGEAAVVRASAFLVQDLQDARVRQCLDGELLAEARRPGERLLELADVLADGVLVVDVERSRVLLDDFLKLVLGEREGLLAHMLSSCKDKTTKENYYL